MILRQLEKTLVQKVENPSFKWIDKIIQEGYNKDFGLGIVSQEISLGDKINELEFYINKYLNTIMEQEVGSD